MIYIFLLFLVCVFSQEINFPPKDWWSAGMCIICRDNETYCGGTNFNRYEWNAKSCVENTDFGWFPGFSSQMEGNLSGEFIIDLYKIPKNRLAIIQIEVYVNQSFTNTWFEFNMKIDDIKIYENYWYWGYDYPIIKHYLPISSNVFNTSIIKERHPHNNLLTISFTRLFEPLITQAFLCNPKLIFL